MGYRQLMASTAYRSWKNWTIGDMIEGTLQKISEDDYGKPNYMLKVISIDFEDKEAEVEVGANFTLNSNGALDYAINQNNIGLGATIKVIYKGEDVMTKGKYKGKKFHKLEVLAKDDRMPEESALETAGSEATDDDLLG